MKTLLVLALLVASTAASLGDEEAAVTKHILDILSGPDYNNAVRPSVEGAATGVKIQVYIRGIDVDDLNSQINFDITFRMVWEDPRLEFGSFNNRMNYVNILKPHLAWLPDAFFKKAVTTQRESVYPESYLRVNMDGGIIYSTRLHLTQKCETMNPESFPHETLTCTIMVASYGFTSDSVNMTADASKAMQLSKILSIKNYDLQDFGHRSCSSKTITGTYSCVAFDVSLKRANSFVLTWYPPLVILVAVSWLALLLPPSQFLARLHVILLPLLILLVLICQAASKAPRPSVSMPFDVFSWGCVTFLLLPLVYVTIAHLTGSPQVSSVEDGEDKAGGWRGAVRKASSLGDKMVLGILAVAYAIFLVAYFSAN